MSRKSPFVFAPAKTTHFCMKGKSYGASWAALGISYPTPCVFPSRLEAAGQKVFEGERERGVPLIEADQINVPRAVDLVSPDAPVVRKRF